MSSWKITIDDINVTDPDQALTLDWGGNQPSDSNKVYAGDGFKVTVKMKNKMSGMLEHAFGINADTGRNDNDECDIHANYGFYGSKESHDPDVDTTKNYLCEDLKWGPKADKKNDDGQYVKWCTFTFQPTGDYSDTTILRLLFDFGDPHKESTGSLPVG